MVAELLLANLGVIPPNLKRIFGLSPHAPPHGAPSAPQSTGAGPIHGQNTPPDSGATRPHTGPPNEPH